MAATPRIAHAEALRDRIQVMLAVAGLQAVHVTLNPLEIVSASRNGVVVISPPDLAFPTYTITDVTNEVTVIAGPPDNLLEAWRRLDAILEALRLGGLEMTGARADSFAVKDSQPIPGYSLTLTDTVIDESETP